MGAALRFAVARRFFAAHRAAREHLHAHAALNDRDVEPVAAGSPAVVTLHGERRP